MATVFDFVVRTREGRELALEQYRGKVLLIVNTASRCGFTPQYAGLQQLHRDLEDRGLTVLGFPCNQFGAQEPGDDEEIGRFCSMTYDVGFPVLAKVDVNGASTSPLFGWLKHKAPGLLGSEAIKWNFTKFLVDRSGRAVIRYAPTTKPADLRDEVDRLLA